jgi:dTDP-4-dehydrorhamnose 3,5-epimerase
MEFRELSIPGCYEITPPVYKDHRGVFTKTFNADVFGVYGLQNVFKEQYYTHSNQGVLRGLHFQIPPADHAKLVCCLKGEVLDVMLDLRVGSPKYAQHEKIRLSSASSNTVYLPAGIAHGFYTISDSLLLYNTTTSYARELDCGIRWDSLDIQWTSGGVPIISKRDSELPLFNEFISPFTYKEPFQL